MPLDEKPMPPAPPWTEFPLKRAIRHHQRAVIIHGAAQSVAPGQTLIIAVARRLRQSRCFR